MSRSDPILALRLVLQMKPPPGFLGFLMLFSKVAMQCFRRGLLWDERVGLFRPSGLHCTCSLGFCISWFGQSIIMVPTRPSQASLVLRPPPPDPAGVFCALSSSAPWLWCVRWLSHLHVPYLTVAWGRLWEAITPFLLCTSHTWEPCACLPNLEEARR